MDLLYTWRLELPDGVKTVLLCAWLKAVLQAQKGGGAMVWAIVRLCAHAWDLCMSLHRYTADRVLSLSYFLSKTIIDVGFDTSFSLF